MALPEIPQTWLIALLIVSLMVLRYFGIDSYTTAGISAVIGYMTGKHIEQAKTAAVYYGDDKINEIPKLP